MLGSKSLREKILRKSLKIEDGRVKFFNKIDYMMFPAAGMAEFFQKIGDDLGEEYLFNLGYEAGTDGSNEMFEKLKLINNPIFLNLNVITSMFEALGFGKLDIKVLKSDKGIMRLTEHPAIDYAKKKFGPKSHVCALYRGIFSIHAEKELKLKNCKLIETQCICKGAKYCEWSHNYFKKPNPNKTKKKINPKKV